MTIPDVPTDPVRPTTYWDYIRVEDLLGLQSGHADSEDELANDEVLFVTVHQVFELWFKLIHRELRTARDLFDTERVAEQELSGVVASLRRITTILRVATDHFQVVETLPTREYLAFRNKLMPASGFQSAGLRQIEILLGLEEKDRLPFGAQGSHMTALRYTDGRESPALARVEAQLADGPTLKQAIEAWLERTPIDGVEHDASDADTRLVEFADRYLVAHSSEVDTARARAESLATHDQGRAALVKLYAKEKEDLRAFLDPAPIEGEDPRAARRRARSRAAMIFIETYRELPLLAWPREVLAGLLELEQAFLVFRQRHARMVERVIGRRTGTGGTAGVDYLDGTALRYRIFRDLWAVRTLMVRRDAAPRLENEGYYAFRREG